MLLALTESLDEYGIAGTTDILQLNTKSATLERDLLGAQRVVCTVFDMDMEELFGVSRKMPRKYAFPIWSFIAFKELGYSLSDMTSFSGKSESILSKAVKFYETMPVETKFDREIRGKWDQIIALVKQLISQWRVNVKNRNQQIS